MSFAVAAFIEIKDKSFYLIVYRVETNSKLLGRDLWHAMLPK